MDRKSIIILLISFVLLIAWFPITNMLYPPKPAPAVTNQVTLESNVVVRGVYDPQGATLSAATNTLSAPVTNQPPREEKTLVLENEDARYIFTSIGGGLKLVELKHFPADVTSRRKSRRAETGSVSLNTKAPAPAFGILQNGDTNSLAAFTLTRQGNTVRAEAPLPGGLHLVKEYELSSNYLVKALIRYENRSEQNAALPTRELVIGTATPMGRHDETLHLGLEWYDGSDTTKITEGWFANRTLGCLPGTPRFIYQAGLSNIAWAAVHNQFFTMIAVPELPAAQIVGRKVSLPPPTREEMAEDPIAFANPFGYQTAILLPDQVLPARSQLEQRYELYAGPKEYKTLQRLPKNMDLVMGFGGFFGFFAKALLLSMNGVNAMGVGYGLAIIIITVIIKLLFWPLTNASTRSMKRMAALQPQMKALQEKYKDDPRKMNMKLMEFMKENKVSPLGGCLPLLLQIPVFFGFYTMLQSAIELRGAQFLWAADLSQPDTIFFIGGFPVNIMPLLMGATMLWQARLTPMSTGMDPMQQQIMKYMPLIMVVFLYNFSAGLTLYWTVQNLLSILQMKVTRTEPMPAAGAAKAVTPARPVVPPKKKTK
jgi:YidC/Oxa1 family membrane protein insertase